MRLVGYIPNKGDKRTVINAITDVASRYEDETEPELCYTFELDEFEKKAAQAGGIDLCLSDTEPISALQVVRRIRADFPRMHLLLIADPKLSPMAYIRPDILPSSLLIRPLEEKAVKKSFDELMRMLLMQLRKTESKAGKFVLDTKQNRQLFDHTDIMYFEARDKRLYLNTAREAVPFYSTLDKLQTELPSMYVRCHKSFIVNTWCIRSVNFSEGLIELENGIAVPISRSYRAEIRALKIGGAS
ncbi:MAG: LytTR family DNA-binding domain-containing protein [Clostridia bacterium]|nr:LytTR family DNA-binding domain-containing protein [Clostridia bacterium]